MSCALGWVAWVGCFPGYCASVSGVSGVLPCVAWVRWYFCVLYLKFNYFR